MNSESSLLIRELVSEKEFFLVDDLYQRCFGDSSVPTFTQKDWWNHYRRGITGIFLDESPIGGLSYWPIDTQTFIGLRDGRLKEREIDARNFNAVLPDYIYISDIAIELEFRGMNYADLLLEYFFFSVKEYVDAGGILTICAFGYSVAGSKILNKSGFKKVADAENTADKQDFYVLAASRK